MRVLVQSKATQTVAAIAALKEKGFVQNEQFGVRDHSSPGYQMFAGEWPDTLTKLRTELLIIYAWEDTQQQIDGPG